MSKPNVLVITEQTDMQDELQTILTEQYEYLAAHTGVDGVAISRMARPAAIFVDMNLPRFQAVGVCKSLLANEHARTIPVFVVADESAQADGDLSALANFKGMLPRPFHADDVKSKLQAALSGAPVSGGKAGARAGAKRDEPIRVLSVDDSSVVRKLVTMILTAEGFKVSTASDGLEGVNKAKEIKPDIILLDFVMPKMNGFQVCRILQKDEKLRHIPVILVTSKGDKVGDKFVDQLGVTGYITKPFQPEELVSKIHQTLEGQPSTAEPSAAAGEQAATPTFEEEAAAPAEHPAPAAPKAEPAKHAAPAHAAPVAAAAPHDMEQQIKHLVKAEVEAAMASLEKHLEKLVVEKLNEYIRRAKKKDA